jgi:carbonic anhydrase/acetyltransferase-like protein (isoleucine patch superfamily)
MSSLPAPVVVPFEGATPDVADTAFVAPGAILVGRVVLEAGASVWYGAVLRADAEPITLGEDSNVQDACVAHTDTGFPVTLGRRVSVGHGVVLHGCTVGDEVIVGMGARLLNGSVIGAGSLVAAGSVVLEGQEVPPRSLVAGVPARVVRTLSDTELERVRKNADDYVDLRERHRRAVDEA